MNIDYTWLEIDIQALANNISLFKKINNKTQIAPVIKSNAYGHGIEILGKLCQMHDDVSYICVIDIEEAIFLRKSGVRKKIVILSIPLPDLEAIPLYNLECVVFDMETAIKLNQIGKYANKQIQVHFEIDTGLSRSGILYNYALEVLNKILELPFLKLAAVFTHFAESESENQNYTNLQINRLNILRDGLYKNKIEFKTHASSTAAITLNEAAHFDIVRPGIGIYGLWASEDTKNITTSKYPWFNLKPALSWKTKILQIKTIPAHSYVGYDRTFQVVNETKVALLPIGYYHGYDREFSNKAYVLINNTLAPVIGRVSMNLTIVDVSKIENINLEDEVVLLSEQSEICADALAKICNTINYEVVTRINPLIKRIPINSL